jgi:hypothetical protein
MLVALSAKCPELVESNRWQQAFDDGRRFLTTWGEQAHDLGWTAHELFGLHPVPDKPHPSFDRLARYDSTGLIWFLRGRPVIALSRETAAIQSATAVITYRKSNKPALGPLNDSLEDFR